MQYFSHISAVNILFKYPSLNEQAVIKIVKRFVLMFGVLFRNFKILLFCQSFQRLFTHHLNSSYLKPYPLPYQFVLFFTTSIIFNWLFTQITYMVLDEMNYPRWKFRIKKKEQNKMEARATRIISDCL